MTKEMMKVLSLPIADTDILYVECALEWLKDNTTLEFIMDDMESIKNLPSGAKLFLVKFCEVAKKDITVSSESVGPMSQSFFAESGERQLRGLARQLVRPYLKSTVQFIPCQRRWHGWQ